MFINITEKKKKLAHELTITTSSMKKKKEDIVSSHMKHTLKCKGVDNTEVSTVILEAWMKLLLTVDRWSDPKLIFLYV